MFQADFMRLRNLELKKMRERIAKRRESDERRIKLFIENLSTENFCGVLDSLPLKFKFKLTNISEEFDGNWEKTIFEDKTQWNKDGKFLLSSSFYKFRDKVFDEILKEKGGYYKVKRSWQRLIPILISDDKTQSIMREKGQLTRILTKQKLDELYHKRNKSLEDIAREYETTRPTVMKSMKKYGLIRRTKSKARMEAIKKGKFGRLEYHDIDENFFGEWSPEMAWVLGLLFTDGNVFPGRISLSSIDVELLEKVKALLKSTKPLIKQAQSYDKTKCVYRFEFYREKMRENLDRLGLHQRKSLNMIFPNVPEEYVRHFIRGCWDGDGSIFVSGGKVNANYTCGSFDFMDRLVQELYKIGIHKRRPPLDKVEAGQIWLNYAGDRFPVILTRVPLKIHKAKRSKSYYIKIDAKENLEKLFNYFYDGVNESMYLERKFKVFAKGLGVITNGLQEVKEGGRGE
jgi:hypothetical protein